MVPTFALDPGPAGGGADPLPEAHAQFEQDFGGRVYTSLEDLLAGVQVDAVYLATPVEAHLQQIQVLADAGIHVLMEKPMARCISTVWKC